MDFQLVVDSGASSTPRASTWVYSKLLHQVFTTMGHNIPLTFITSKVRERAEVCLHVASSTHARGAWQPVPEGCYILAHLQYTRGEHKGVIVHRCATHKSNDKSKSWDDVACLR